MFNFQKISGAPKLVLLPNKPKIKKKPSPSPTMAEDDQSPRGGKSLGLLTRKFVELLQNSNHGVVSLKEATEILCVTQKRRIYDITNVLEGIGLIEKISKNSVQWKGGNENRKNTEQRSNQLTIRTKELSDEEIELDEHITKIKQSLKNVQEDVVNKFYAYVTRDDLTSVYGNDVILTARNFETLDVPRTVSNGGNHDGTILRLRSKREPIEVRLVTDEGSTHCQTKVTNLNENNEEIDAIKLEMDSGLSDESSAGSATNIRVKRKRKFSQVGGMPSDLKDVNDIMCDEMLWKDRMQLAQRLLTIPGELLRLYDEEELTKSTIAMIPLSPPPSDYQFSLRPDEGICDLFDVMESEFKTDSVDEDA